MNSALPASQSLNGKISLQKLINPTERQLEFLRAIEKHNFVLYGGAAGGGKSYILRWWLVIYLAWLYKAKGLRNVQCALFCEDYPSLYDRQISKIKYEFPESIGRLREGTTKDFQLRPEFGGGIIALRNLDDPSKYQSAEFAAIAVDELTKNPLETFDFLRFRLRWPGIENPKFAGASNPGGKGHAWVKRLWIERSFPTELEPRKDEFAFVKAKASDNPHLTSTYYKDLLSLPPDMARKFAEGSWDVYTGQFFPQFDQKRHVIPAVEAVHRVKFWHTKWISGDWGYFHPHCILWHAKDEHNRVITYRELWGTRVGEVELGANITKANAGDKLRAFAFSWDAGKLSPRSAPKYPKAISQLVADSLGAGIPKPHPADSSPGSRVSGWRLMSQLLDAEGWLISDACPKLIQCLPTLIRDENNEEDVLKVDYAENEVGDDPADCARMGLQYALGTTKPDAVKLQEAMIHVRQQFVPQVVEAKPGEQDFFSKFGGARS